MTLSTAFGGIAVGRHVVEVWRLDDNMVLQKLVLTTWLEPHTYLGPTPVA